MATDIGRINAAMGSILALDYQGPEKFSAHGKLIVLSRAVKKAQAENDKATAEKAKTPEFLRCAADYQDAPHGTQIAKRFGSGWWMKVDEGWIDESRTVMPGSHIAVAPREVVEWGAV